MMDYIRDTVIRMKRTAVTFSLRGKKINSEACCLATSAEDEPSVAGAAVELIRDRRLIDQVCVSQGST